MSHKAIAPAKGWIGEFDGLRALAVTAVFSMHVTSDNDLKLPYLLDLFTGVGWMGVDLFFVLSGYLITGILMESKGRPRYWRRFIIRRALKILPVYLPLLLFAIPMTMGPWLEGKPVPPPWSLPLFLQNWWVGRADAYWSNLFVPTWSLAIEEQFYLLWPWIVLFCSRRQLAQLSITVIVLSPIVRALCLPYAGPHACYMWTCCRLDGLAMGALAQLITSGRHRQLQTGAAVVAPWLVGSLFALIALDLCNRATLLFTTLGYSLLGVTASTVLIALRSGYWTQVGRALTWKPLATLGRVSYGFYLGHETAIWVCMSLWHENFGQPTTLVAMSALTLATFSLSFLLAYASWRLWEEPWLRLKGRLAP